MRTWSALFLSLFALPAAAQQPRIQVRDLPARAFPAGMPGQGRPVAVKRWTDRLGENTLILTQTGRARSRECPDPDGGCSDADVYAYHWVRKPEGMLLLWTTHDFVRGCPVDLSARYVPESVAVTDLDGDGVAETSFVYFLACRGDVSPATMKLILHEGAQKYAARGTSRPRGATEGGEVRMDEAFARGPRPFASFANAQWLRFRGSDNFQ